MSLILNTPMLNVALGNAPMLNISMLNVPIFNASNDQYLPKM